MTEPATATPMMPMTPIGEIRTSYTAHDTTPVQTAINPDAIGRAVIRPDLLDGLAGLVGFDHAWLLTWLAATTETGTDARPVPLRQVPFLLSATGREIGLFAMRGPRRPNPIGLHLVRLVSVTDDGFTFAGVDMIDRTPLLDIKPYVAPLDVPPGDSLTTGVRNGWFDEVDLSLPHTPRSLADPPSVRRTVND